MALFHFRHGIRFRQTICYDAGLSISNFLSTSNEIHDHVHMHLLTDCSWESLISHSFLNCLLSETDRIYDAFHFIHFFYWNVLLFSCYIFVVLYKVWLLCIYFIGPDVKAVCVRILSTVLKNKVSLVLSFSSSLLFNSCVHQLFCLDFLFLFVYLLLLIRAMSVVNTGLVTPTSFLLGIHYS